MAHWRYILHCLFMLVLAAGSAAAEKDMPAAGDSLTLVASASGCARNGASWFFPKSSQNLYRLYDTDRTAVTGNVIMKEPAGRSSGDVARTAFVDQELEAARIDDEGLGRISGGATLFATPDVVSQRLFAIILWDEGKAKQSAPYEQGNGHICSTISVQGR